MIQDEMSFGEWLHWIRILSGQTITECAERAEIRRQTWSNLENSYIKQPQYSTLEGIAEALGLPLAFVLQRVGYKALPEQTKALFADRLLQLGYSTSRAEAMVEHIWTFAKEGKP